MNKKIFNGKNAYYEYIKKEEGIEIDILSYIAQRINENKDEINKLIELTKEKIKFEQINKLFVDRESEYKSNKKIEISEDNFVRGTLITPKGILLKEESEIKKVIELYISAILSRNAIVISDKEYIELGVKNLILEIIHQALKKFNVDENLIQLLPYEEVNDDEFDKYHENNKMYIYLEDEEFKNEVKDEEVIKGEIEEVIEKINSEGICECAVIYTKDKEKAYKFINYVNGKNVFVNANSSNMVEDVLIDDFYIHKNVIYPMPK